MDGYDIRIDYQMPNLTTPSVSITWLLQARTVKECLDEVLIDGQHILRFATAITIAPHQR